MPDQQPEKVRLISRIYRALKGNWEVPDSTPIQPIQPIQPAVIQEKPRRTISYTPSQVKYQTGLSSYLAGDMTGASKNWNEAVKLDPTNAYAIRGLQRLNPASYQATPESMKTYNVGLDAYLKGNNQVALKQFQKALTIDPKNREARRAMERITGKVTLAL